jgi:hypothetical protein
MIAFVYKWTDNKTGKLYIGVHKGSTDDGYICSSKHMLREYKDRPDDFQREILEWFDNYGDARAYETDLLVEADAANNPSYYNRTNGQGFVGCRT